MATDERRRRTYFPAAQFVGSNPAIEAMNRPQSEWGTPAAGKRLGRGDLTTYQLPSGGFATVKTGSRVPTGARLTQVGNQLPVDYNAAYAKGYGAPAPTPLEGGFLARGEVGVPAEQLTPTERSRYGFSGNYGQTFGERFTANAPAISGGLSMLGKFGTLGFNALASLSRKFSGAPAQYAQQQFNEPTPYYTGNPTQPTRYFDF